MWHSIAVNWSSSAPHWTDECLLPLCVCLFKAPAQATAQCQMKRQKPDSVSLFLTWLLRYGWKDRSLPHLPGPTGDDNCPFVRIDDTPLNRHSVSQAPRVDGGVSPT